MNNQHPTRYCRTKTGTETAAWMLPKAWIASSASSLPAVCRKAVAAAAAAHTLSEAAHARTPMLWPPSNAAAGGKAGVAAAAAAMEDQGRR